MSELLPFNFDLIFGHEASILSSLVFFTDWCQSFFFILCESFFHSRNEVLLVQRCSSFSHLTTFYHGLLSAEDCFSVISYFLSSKSDVLAQGLLHDFAEIVILIFRIDFIFARLRQFWVSSVGTFLVAYHRRQYITCLSIYERWSLKRSSSDCFLRSWCPFDFPV